MKFLDEREVEVHPHERGQAFNHKTVWQRIAIVAAGPIANLLLCILLLWAMFVIGKQDYSPTIGRVSGIAASAGLTSGDRVLRVDERPVITLGEASMALTAAAMDRRDVTLEVLDPADQVRVRTLPRLGVCRSCPPVSMNDACRSWLAFTGSRGCNRHGSIRSPRTPWWPGSCSRAI